MLMRDARITKRLHIEQDGKEYIAEIYDRNGYYAIVEDLETRNIARAYNELNESVAITKAIESIK